MSIRTFLCDTCNNNNEDFPFLQCPAEPMEPKSHYEANNKVPLNSSDYEYLVNLRKKECGFYDAR